MSSCNVGLVSHSHLLFSLLLTRLMTHQLQVPLREFLTRIGEALLGIEYEP